MDPADAIFTAAHYLCANGAGRGEEATARAVWHYNHADWYVALVLKLAGQYAAAQAPADRPYSRRIGGRRRRATAVDAARMPLPSMPPMPFSASPTSLGMIHSLFESPSAIFGSVWRYW